MEAVTLDRAVVHGTYTQQRAGQVETCATPSICRHARNRGMDIGDGNGVVEAQMRQA